MCELYHQKFTCGCSSIAYRNVCTPRCIGCAVISTHETMDVETKCPHHLLEK
jgi:hypothetical protein